MRQLFLTAVILGTTGIGFHLQDLPGSETATNLAAWVRQQIDQTAAAASTIADQTARSFALEELGNSSIIVRDLARATRIAARIPDPAIKIRLLCSLASAQSRAGDPSSAKRAIEEALKAAESVTDGAASTEAMRQIAILQVRLGDDVAAMRTVGRERYVKSSVIQAVAATQAEMGRVAAAMQTTKALGESEQIAEACHEVAIALARVNDIPGARSAYEEASRLSNAPLPSDASGFTYAILQAQNRTADQDGAKESLNRLKGVAARKVFALGLIDVALARIRSKDQQGGEAYLSEALDQVKAVKDPYDQFAVIDPLVEAAALLESERATLEIKQVAQTLPLEQLRDLALAKVAASLARTRRIAEAVRTASEIHSSKSRDLAERSVVQAQATSGDMAGAKGTLQRMREPSSKVFAYQCIALAYQRLGLQVKAQDAVQRGVALCRGQADAAAKCACFRFMVQAHAEMGDREHATTLLSEMLQAAKHLPTERGKAEIISDTARMFSSLGRREQLPARHNNGG